ncbi:hypothetical protein DFH06DRAFT_1365982 [Mycena polygramma]|nr:hypothetical protein DFH06DRAFT_1365982 [Mycena polygramma]
MQSGSLKQDWFPKELGDLTNGYGQVLRASFCILLTPLVKQEFLTEWDGYEERTWEPIESFMGKKYAVRLFWSNADCGHRNHEQLSRFKTGEVIKLKNTSFKESPRKKKPGPGRSSVGLITGTRVFALCPEDKLYHSGVVQRFTKNNSYVVRFEDDNTEAKVSLKHMRPCEQLREGDSVILKTDNVVVGKVRSDGSFIVNKRVDYTTVKLSSYDVEKEWADRKLAHEEIVFEVTKLGPKVSHWHLLLTTTFTILASSRWLALGKILDLDEVELTWLSRWESPRRAFYDVRARVLVPLPRETGYSLPLREAPVRVRWCGRFAFAKTGTVGTVEAIARLVGLWEPRNAGGRIGLSTKDMSMLRESSVGRRLCLWRERARGTFVHVRERPDDEERGEGHFGTPEDWKLGETRMVAVLVIAA